MTLIALDPTSGPINPGGDRRLSPRPRTLDGAVIGLVIGQAFDGTVMPLIAGFAACGLLALAAVLVTERGRLFRQGA